MRPQDKDYTLQQTSVSFSLFGALREAFTAESDEHEIVIRPKQPLSRRCTIRPAALFEHEHGFPDVNTVMGRLVFASGSTQAQRYRPFTLDEHRRLCEVFLPIEAMPDDDWTTSTCRWFNYQTMAHRLLEAAGESWGGLSDRDVDELVRFVPWPEPLEGCILHALVQRTARRGVCVVEIGSFRGRSLSMMAMALRGVDSDSTLISIDPHLDEPHNQAHVRLALAQIGEEDRLVQFRCTSDRASKLLRQGSASLVFVDGDHAFDQVLSDFNHFRDILAPGGCLLFHDYGYGDHNGRPEADPEVRKAIDHHVLADATLSPLLLAHTLFAFVKRG